MTLDSDNQFQFGAAHFTFSDGGVAEIVYKVPALRMLLVGRESTPTGDEWKVPGVYFLIGPGESPASYRIYVGKSQKLSERVPAHKSDSQKDWFDRALLVVSDRRSSGFTEADIACLEAHFTGLLRRDVGVENKAQPSSSDMDTWERHELSFYVSPIEAVLRLLGILTPSYEPELEVDEELRDATDTSPRKRAAPGTGLSWVDAAKKVLPKDGSGMRTKDILEKIIEGKHRDPGEAKTPAATLRRDLRVYTQKEGSTSSIKQVGPGTFALDLENQDEEGDN